MSKAVDMSSILVGSLSCSSQVCRDDALLLFMHYSNRRLPALTVGALPELLAGWMIE